ncbi:MAG: hypothetical protein ACYS8X_01000 [Planctomycetota bacterium]|jgi:hypothetical protein
MLYHLSKLLNRVGDKPVQSLVTTAVFVLILCVVSYHLILWVRRRNVASGSWLMLVADSSGGVLRVLVGLAILGGMALHLSFQSVEFQRKRGGVSERNYNAVETIWGRPHIQKELDCSLVYETEHYYNKDGLEIDRDKLEAATEVVGYRKSKTEHVMTGNPIKSADHDIVVKLNYREKGKALYPTFETTCVFRYRLVNFTSRDLEAKLSFPLPSRQGLVRGLTIKVDDAELRRQVEMSSSSVSWKMPMSAGQTTNLTISYRSRGMDYIKLDPGSGRQLADYRVTMECDGIAKADLDYPMGCMTPTQIVPGAVAEEGTTLIWQLKRAVTRMGMGLIVPKPQQGGYYVGRVLSAAPWGLVLLLVGVLVTHLTSRTTIRWLPLLLLAASYHLYYLLTAHIGDYAPGLVGGMILGGVALTSLVVLLQLGFYRGLNCWAPVGLFIVFCLAYPLIRISEHEGLLLTVLYVALLANTVLLTIHFGKTRET